MLQQALIGSPTALSASGEVFFKKITLLNRLQNLLGEAKFGDFGLQSEFETPVDENEFSRYSIGLSRRMPVGAKSLIFSVTRVRWY
jgi:hypothetical protein